MSARFRRSNYKSLIKDKEEDKDKKDVESFASKDGSVTIVKTEKIHKNYRFNKLIQNDEDAKIIQDFCRAKMKTILEKKREEKRKNIQKEQEEAKNTTNSKRGYFSKYRRNFQKQQENESQNKEQETENNKNNDEINKSKKINENSGENKRENQTKENTEENNNGKKLFRRRFQKDFQNSNENTLDKVKNEQEESNLSNRYKRKKYNSKEKKEQKEEEKKPKYIPTYHEKKKIDKNSSQLENDFNDKNYRYQEIEAIPVRFCDYYEEYPRMRFYSPGKSFLVEPYLNPEIIITKIKFEENFIPPSNIGYGRGINNNFNYYNKNITKNESLYRNKNSYGRQIFKTQYSNEYKLSRPFENANISRNNGYIVRRKQNTQFHNHELKASYASEYS